MDIKDFRKEYHSESLTRESLNPDPAAQFLKWLKEAVNAKIDEPNAMALATASKAGKPSCRMVLFKHFDEGGLIFYTNYQSRKARELSENPYAAASIFWKDLERQVSIEGVVQKLTKEESEEYFKSRPRESKLGAWASRQDAVIPSRAVLEKEYARLEEKYKDKDIPMPPFWGGYRLKPERFEFWQGRNRRLHDRFLYSREGNVWKIERLSP